MKVFLPLVFSLLWSNTLAVPFASPQADRFTKRNAPGKSGADIPVDPTAALSDAFTISNGTSLGGHLARSRHRKRNTALGNQWALPLRSTAGEKMDPYDEVDETVERLSKKAADSVTPDDLEGNPRYRSEAEFKMWKLLEFCVETKKELFHLNNPAGREITARVRGNMLLECFDDFDVKPAKDGNPMALPEATFIPRAIQAQLKLWGTYRKLNLDQERQKGTLATEDSREEKRSGSNENPNQALQMKVGGHLFGLPALKVDRGQARQLFQQAKDRVQHLGKTLPVAAMQARFSKVVPSMQQMPKLARPLRV